MGADVAVCVVDPDNNTDDPAIVLDQSHCTGIDLNLRTQNTRPSF